MIVYYNEFDLVLRNYYYTPLLEHSFYLPVGLTLFDYAIGNNIVASVYRWIENFRKFKGRIKYENLLHAENLTILGSYGAHHHVKDRKLLLELSFVEQLGGCVVCLFTDFYQY